MRKTVGGISGDHFLLQHSGITLFMQTSVCTSIVSCQEV